MKIKSDEKINTCYNKIEKQKKQEENGEYMNHEAKKTEQLIQIYKEDGARENLQALIHQMKKTVFFIPAMLPDTPEVREAKQKVKENPGRQIQLPKGTAPMPAILNSNRGEKFFPVYSSQEQIPKEPKFDLLMNMPFQACCAMALDERLETQGLAINPFTANLIFRKELLLAIQKGGELPEVMQERKLTPKQYQIMMRQKAEFHDFPMRAFQEGEAFVRRLSDEREAVVDEVYRNAFQKKELYPYRAEHFSVMALNISEELLLVQVDLPEAADAAQLCHRVYVTLNPKSNEIHYFTIEKGKGKDERNLGGISADGRHLEYGEAPVEGAEIQKIMDVIRREKEQTN